MEKDKFSFVTTKFDGVFALKLSKRLPLTKDKRFDFTPAIFAMSEEEKKQWEKQEAERELSKPYFLTSQCGHVIHIVETDNPDEREFEVEVDGGDKIFIAKEYNVILVDKFRVSLVDEETYLEAYDLGNRAINRKEYEILKQIALEY